jgi:aspartate ammonia-lyase
MKYRIEHDPLGKKKVPAEAYYGIHTQRALENFPISGMRIHDELIWAIGAIKLAAAQTNAALKLLDARKAKAIVRAAAEVLSGKWNHQFVVDPFEAGAGTPMNMNANEVIANRAIELLGAQKGDYQIVHPNDHVNMSQSTNDVIPSSIRIACLRLLPRLVDECTGLQRTLAQKARQFKAVAKSGRTHLQDAVPILLGQEFSGYAAALAKRAQRLAQTKSFLSQVNLGGTAIGTGINTHPRYRQLVVKHLRTITTFKLSSAPNLFEGTSSLTDFVAFSGTLRSLAVDLSKLCNDVRLLSSGPRTGLAELALPAVEPGSSIMPGKINPSMAEMLNMVCDQVIGNDAAISTCAQQGQLELNVMMPTVAHNVLQSIKLLTNGIREFTNRCVTGIKANKQACGAYYVRSLGLATLLSPELGYDKAAALAQEALKKGKTIRRLVLDKKLLSEKELDRLLDPKRATQPNR